MILIDQGDLKTRLRETHGNAAAHGAGADDANTLDRFCFSACRHALNFGCRAFCEELVSQRARLRVRHTGLKGLPLKFQSLLKGHRASGIQAIENSLGSSLPLEAFGDGIAGAREQRGIVIIELQRKIFGEALAGSPPD